VGNYWYARDRQEARIRPEDNNMDRTRNSITRNSRARKRRTRNSRKGRGERWTAEPGREEQETAGKGKINQGRQDNEKTMSVSRTRKGSKRKCQVMI
jgi:hypothetical protein